MWNWASQVVRRWHSATRSSPVAEFPAPLHENPIQTLLTKVQVPWLSSRRALAKRYGVRLHPAYEWDIIEIDNTQSLLAGLLWSLSFLVASQFSPKLPVIEFSSVASVGDGVSENLRSVVDQLVAKLGDPMIDDRSNTVARRWTFGAASVSAIVWPPDLQDRPNRSPSHDRDPRLNAGCHVDFKTGFRLAPTATEMVELETFVPIHRIPDRWLAKEFNFDLPAEPYELEFVREPVADATRLFGYVGHSADRAALIFCHAQLYIVPMQSVIRFRVARVLPAKGSGGSTLYVECRSEFCGVTSKQLRIGAASGVEDCNDPAQALSAATSKPFKLDDYVWDE
jgi:hypothetical protein